MSKQISKEMAGQGAPGDEFIVRVNFEYCEVIYSGYQILTRELIVELCEQLETDREIGTPNMPKWWMEEFDISRLKGVFTIHSDRAEDIEAMRGLFGEAVGNTDLIDSVLDYEEDYEEEEDCDYDEEDYEEEEDDCEDGEEGESEVESPELIDEQVARRFLEDSESIDLSEATEITDEAAESLSKHEGYLSLDGLTSISDAAAEALSKFNGWLSLSGLTTLTDAAAESLS